MSRKWTTLGGIALIAFGILLLFSMVGASFARTRVFHSRMDYAQLQAVQQAPAADDAATSAPSDSYHSTRNWHAYHGRPGAAWSSPSARFGPLSFLGGILKLFLFGLIAFLLMKKLRKHKKGDPEPVAKVIDEDDIESGIRVGDEVGSNPTAVDPDEMSVDDLVRAMKRLGIKKLEL